MHESNGLDIIIALIVNDINPLGRTRMDLVLDLKNSASKLLLAIMESRNDSENADRILANMNPRQLLDVACRAFHQETLEEDVGLVGMRNGGHGMGTSFGQRSGSYGSNLASVQSQYFGTNFLSPLPPGVCATKLLAIEAQRVHFCVKTKKVCHLVITLIQMARMNEVAWSDNH
jgi:hypothetical protein